MAARLADERENEPLHPRRQRPAARSGFLQCCIQQFKRVPHAGEETAVVQAGRVELELENRLVELDLGDSVHIPSDIMHRWRNPHDEPATVIFALSAPLF